MVQGRVWLTGGGTIRIQAKDMLSALKEATDAYGSRIKRMTMKQIEVGQGPTNAVDCLQSASVASDGACSPLMADKEGEEDGGCGMGEDHHGHVRQPEDQASSAAS